MNTLTELSQAAMAALDRGSVEEARVCVVAMLERFKAQMTSMAEAMAQVPKMIVALRLGDDEWINEEIEKIGAKLLAAERELGITGPLQAPAPKNPLRGQSNSGTVQRL